MKVPLDQILFRIRSVLATLWVLLLLVFSDPWISVCSALLFIPGLLVRFWAAGFIGPQSRDRQIATDHLATRGPYALFRHPLYVGNALLVAAGLALLRPYWILIVLTAVGFVLLYLLIGRAEERKLAERYGDEYEEFCRRVTPFFPKRFVEPLFAGFNLRWALNEYNTWIWVALLYLLAFLRTLLPKLI
ncbi:MAG: isoprenylcysteine carboxylmethyltransferase family protein [candidate division WOR-3 bacterium]|nr:isoprenylcysteine carboxylmethyltransferase family protein [candidate division WOR-3 bacterium]